MKLKPVMVNPEYYDPVLMVPVPQKAEVVLFDLGYCFRLDIREIRRLSRVFISHTHIDHFIGFDHVLRLMVDQEKTVEIYGPAGIIENVRGKLAGYTWNLAGGVGLNFTVFEVHKDYIYKKEFLGRKGFVNNENTLKSERRDCVICIADDYRVEAYILEHKTPVLGYRLVAKNSFNADADLMKSMSLEPGKWVGELKNMIASGADVSGRFLELTGAILR